MNYVFVFQPDYSEDGCDDNFLEYKKYDQFKCDTSKALSPVLVLVYSDDDKGAPDQANALMEWIYGF